MLAQDPPKSHGINSVFKRTMVWTLVEFLVNSVAYGEMGAVGKIFAQYETKLEGGVFASHTALV